MAKRRWKTQAVFIELESAYLTKETLVGADAIRLMEPATFSIEETDNGSREDWPNIVSTPLDDLAPTGVVGVLSGRSPLAGAGSAFDDSTVYPMLHDLLLSMQLVATVDTTPGSETVSYAPALQDPVGVTAGFLVDGHMHHLVGAVGTGKIVLVAGARAVLEWELRGLYESPATSALVPDFTGEVNAPVIKDASWDWNSQADLVQEFSLDIANNVVALPSINAASVGDSGGGHAGFSVPTRLPVFSFNPESPLVSTYDYWADKLARTRRAFSAGVIGDTQYNRITLSGGGQIREIDKGDRDGWAILTINGICTSSDDATEDAFTLLFT